MDAAPPPPSAYYEVLNDGGGQIGFYVMQADRFRRDRVQVRVKGICASNCKWYFTLRDDGLVCVYPQAWVGHHQDGDAYNFGQMEWERGRDVAARGLVPLCKP